MNEKHASGGNNVYFVRFFSRNSVESRQIDIIIYIYS